MLRNLKIQHRLIGVFLIVSIIPILFLGFYANKLYSESISEKLSASTYQAVSLINKNLLIELQNYQFLNGSISTNEYVQASLGGLSSSEQKLNQTKQEAMDDIFRTIFPSHIVTVSIYDREMKPFYELGYDAIQAGYMDKVLADVHASAPYDGLTYVKTMASNDAFAIGRKIHAELDSSELIGYAFVFVGIDLFSKNILSSVDLGTGSELLIMDTDGTILSSNDKQTKVGEPYRDPQLLSHIQQKQMNNHTSFSGVVNDENQQISYIYNEQIGWYLISLLPYSYINSEISQINFSLIYIVLLIVIFAVIIIYLLNNSIVKPIEEIITFSNQISNGELSIRIQDEYEDEMSVLSRKMNSMVSQIESLIDNQKMGDRRKRELELQMLQSQINPHFLFNTLNTLRWLAVINQVPVLNTGISSLSELLRSTILDHNEEVTIEQELQNLKHYFEIQKIRYADRFKVRYETDESLLSLYIPKLILQPVAENSIIHGTSENGKSIEIIIKAQQVEQLLYLDIEDNGKGFDMSENKKVDHSDKLSGIGIRNVNERIKLHYGEQYGLFISSEVGKGTYCRLIIPVKHQEGG